MSKTLRIARDPYPQDLASEQSTPWHDGFSVEPSDSEELPLVTRELYVGVGGDVRLMLINGQELLFKNAPQGFTLGLRIRKIFKSGTTATNLIGLY